MVHLNRFKQHYWFLGEACDKRCLVCNGLNAQLAEIKNKPGDIVNIYGIPSLAQCMAAIKIAKKNRWQLRGWVTHKLQGIEHNSAQYFDELVIWCPAPEKDQFNQACGEDYFDEYMNHIQQLPCKKTLSVVVKQSNLDELPTFYDWIHELNANGMVLYYPKEFTKEDRQYIKRFNRVPGVQIIPIINKPTHMALGVPNTIGTAKFEWNDWRFQVRQSIRSLPIIKYTLA